MNWIETALHNGWVTESDVEEAKRLARVVHPTDFDAIVAAFFRSVVHCNQCRPSELRERDASLDPGWFRRPWYYFYVQYFGPQSDSESGTFDDLTSMLDYLESLGFKNLYLLPHYESVLADGGYDVSSFHPREALGGEKAFTNFMEAASRRGFCVATDAIFNHISVQHEWFKRACSGEKKYMGYFLDVTGTEKIREEDRNGDIVSIYRDPDGTISERICIFPDVDRIHHTVVDIPGVGKKQYYRGFYPFQIDLNLQNPDVLSEIFEIIGSELNKGVLGKRTDAIAHWVKRSGTTSDGLPETHAVHSLLKRFMKHICHRSIVIPEAVRSSSIIAEYAGFSTSCNGRQCSSEGDAMLSFDMQGRLRESILSTSTDALWKGITHLPPLPVGCTWMNLLDHHDEIYMGFFSHECRQWVGDYIQSKGGIIYKNGMSGGVRISNLLDSNPERLAAALTCMYLIPGVPVVYYGMEIGATSKHEHYIHMEEHQRSVFTSLGIDVSKLYCYDPRELLRGPIARDHFYSALRSPDAAFLTVQKLNKLINEYSSMRGDICVPLTLSPHNYHVFCVVKSNSSRKFDDPPLLCVSNLREDHTTVSMLWYQVAAHWWIEYGSERESVDDQPHVIKCRDLLSETDITLHRRDSRHIDLDVPGYARYVLAPSP
eukprot:TRINITY_DN826_c0_g2_i1.p1 TRINITY_DN826_c0_g2~~TRINITY_DN826_c0_g2_i1.p1  ORF type:complete len:657 (+),score=130.52 TRINITY_DN826_c0_g2_i1:174-2144(+)